MMQKKRDSAPRERTRLVGLTVLGLTEPEVYRVSEDVFRIVGKMLRLNQAAGPYSGHPRLEFKELRFLLRLLGAAPSEAPDAIASSVELWIAEA